MLKMEKLEITRCLALEIQTSSRETAIDSLRTQDPGRFAEMICNSKKIKGGIYFID